MPKPRNPENKGLPARWQAKHGAYYYQVPTGMEHAWDGKKLFRLGKTLPEAYRAWADRIGSLAQAKTIGQLLERYALEVVPTKKSPQSRTFNLAAIVQLRKAFDQAPLTWLKPQHVYRYIDLRSKKQINSKGKLVGGKIVAHREVEVLSHAYTKAVEWGYIDRHPFKGEMRVEGETPRTRYVDDWEVVEALSLPAMRKRGSVRAIQEYIRLKLLTGLRRGDLLRLRDGDCREDGIHVTPRKTAGTSGRAVIYRWTPELERAVAAAKAARPTQVTDFLFCQRTGKGYMNDETDRCDGWDSMWSRFMERVLKETKVKVRFTEHDLRAKCASDAPTLEHAQQLLAHADSRTTKRIYRRKAEQVNPLR